jgi:ankyrin repeat protein
MKRSAVLLLLLLPLLACAGAYEDMEEAVIRKDVDSAIGLLKRGMDVNTVDRQGNTLLIQAIRGDVPGLIDYLMKNRARINTRNKNGETALSIAAYTGNFPCVKRLVEAGAEINFYGWPPLTYAAYNGHLDVADYLIKHGAEVDAKTENGSSALFFAARFGHIDVVKLLLANRADAKIVNENGESAVDWALKGKNTDIADLLREAGGRSGKAVVIELSK